MIDSRTLAEIEHKAQWNDHLPWIDSKLLFEELRKLQEREAAFRDCLKFYADKETWHPADMEGGDLPSGAIYWGEFGDRAREVLARYPESNEG